MGKRDKVEILLFGYCDYLMRGDDGFDQDDSSGGDEKMIDFRYILKLEVIDFVDKLDVEYKKKFKSRMILMFLV